MTINLADNDPRDSYAVGQGVSQSAFTVTFEFFDDADLNVYVDGVLKTLTTDYTTTGGDGSTGTVNFVSPVVGATGGSTVVITRSIDLERTTDFPSSGPFNIASLNTELDRFIAISADLRDQVDRSLKLVDYDVDVDTQMPLRDDRKGKVLAFNTTTGVPEAGPEIGDISTIVAITADISTLADIEDGTIATDAISNLASAYTQVITLSSYTSQLTTLAAISADIEALADIEDGTTATDAISGLSAISSDVTAAVSNEANITSVASNIADINTVSGISSDVSAVAAISGDVTVVADNALALAIALG